VNAQSNGSIHDHTLPWTSGRFSLEDDGLAMTRNGCSRVFILRSDLCYQASSTKTQTGDGHTTLCAYGSSSRSYYYLPACLRPSLRFCLVGRHEGCERKEVTRGTMPRLRSKIRACCKASLLAATGRSVSDDSHPTLYVARHNMLTSKSKN
jgi:hypothetical protein